MSMFQQLRELSSQNALSIVTMIICASTNYVFMHACALPNGTYPFRWMNLMATSFSIAAVFAFFRSENPFGNVTFKLIQIQALSGFGALVPSYLLTPLGLGATSVQITAAVQFAVHPFTAIFNAIFNRKFPGKTISVVIASAAVQIIGYVGYSAKSSSTFSLYGVAILLLSCILTAITTVFNERVASGACFDHIDIWTKTFWYCVCSAAIAYILIPVESYIFYGEFDLQSLIPGNNYNIQAFGFATFSAIFNMAWVQTAYFDASIFVSSWLTGLIVSSLLASALTNFVDFDFVEFTIAFGIYLSALNYKLSTIRSQRLRGMKSTLNTAYEYVAFSPQNETKSEICEELENLLSSQRMNIKK